MKEDIKSCVDVRINMFRDYLEVPESIAEEYKNFEAKMLSIAEESSSVTEFEDQFQVEGLQDEFSSIVTKCVPKAVGMTAEQKNESLNMAKETMFGTSDNAGAAKGLAKMVIKDVADIATTELHQEVLSQNRKRMIEEGTFDDYTRASNTLDNAVAAGKIIGKLFKKK